MSSGPRLRGERRDDPESAADPDRFGDAVRRVLRSLRRGEVVTYGEVADEAGYPGAARAVGNVLAGCDDDICWWRVVTSAGRLVPGHEDEHARRLRAEGVPVTNGRVSGQNRR